MFSAYAYDLLQDTERKECHTQTRSSAACFLKVIAIFNTFNLISGAFILHSGRGFLSLLVRVYGTAEQGCRVYQCFLVVAVQSLILPAQGTESKSLLRDLHENACNVATNTEFDVIHASRAWSGSHFPPEFAGLPAVQFSKTR